MIFLNFILFFFVFFTTQPRTVTKKMSKNLIENNRKRIKCIIFKNFVKSNKKYRIY